MKRIGVYVGICLAISISLINSTGVRAEVASVRVEQADQMVNLPVVHAQSAILMDATTGEVLFEKNSEQRFYPASITKFLTAMVVLERAGLDEVVIYSKSATTNLEAGAVTLGVSQGDRISVRDSLYGMMLKSANEISNGLAEHVSGSVGEFCNLMNAKARSLGATNSNFANPNGLNNPNHYTTAKDFAYIAKAGFDNPMLLQILRTGRYTFPATQRSQAVNIIMGHQMIRTENPNFYEGVIGGKTGYTSKAGNTLVTLAQRDGKRLVTVVLKANRTHYADTKAMLNYGFQIAKASNSEMLQQSEQFEQSAERENKAATPKVENQAILPKVENENLMSQNKEEKSKSEITKVNTKDHADKIGPAGNYGWQSDESGEVMYLMNGEPTKNAWVLDQNVWYYLDVSGKMLKNAMTPDGYQVDEFGRWIGI